MNVSMADDPTFKKIKSSSYNNASEAVLLAGLAREQRESIQRLVRKRLESAGPTDFLEYTGRDGLRELAARVKARGRMKRYRALKGAERDLDALFLYWAERTSLQAAEWRFSTSSTALGIARLRRQANQRFTASPMPAAWCR
jgi:hypothetical protein